MSTKTRLTPQQKLRQVYRKITTRNEVNQKPNMGTSDHGIIMNPRIIEKINEDISEEDISEEQKLGEFKRQITKQRIPLSSVFKTGESYNNVELVRRANANANLQRHLFDTSF